MEVVAFPPKFDGGVAERYVDLRLVGHIMICGTDRRALAAYRPLKAFVSEVTDGGSARGPPRTILVVKVVVVIFSVLRVTSVPTCSGWRFRAATE